MVFISTDLAAKKRRTEANDAWKKANTVIFSIRLQNSTDADIIERLAGAKSRQGEVKKLIRLGMEAERNC